MKKTLKGYGGESYSEGNGGPLTAAMRRMNRANVVAVKLRFRGRNFLGSIFLLQMQLHQRRTCGREKVGTAKVHTADGKGGIGRGHTQEMCTTTLVLCALWQKSTAFPCWRRQLNNHFDAILYNNI